MAGFEVIIYGRIWVITEAPTVPAFGDSEIERMEDLRYTPMPRKM
jgi:hypothetical protein